MRYRNDPASIAATLHDAAYSARHDNLCRCRTCKPPMDAPDIPLAPFQRLAVVAGLVALVVVMIALAVGA